MKKVKQKSRSGPQETRIKKLQREQDKEKQQLLKAAKTEEMLAKCAEKEKSNKTAMFKVFERIMKKAKK